MYSSLSAGNHWIMVQSNVLYKMYLALGLHFFPSFERVKVLNLGIYSNYCFCRCHPE